MAKKAKQAAFVALNVRLPPDLHKRLREAAGTTRSLNAEILDRLQKSFEPDTRNEGWRARFVAYLDRRAEEDFRSLAERLDRLEGRPGEGSRKSRRKTVARIPKGSKQD